MISIAAELLQVDLDFALQILGKAAEPKSRRLDNSSAPQPDATNTLGPRSQEPSPSTSRIEAAANLRPVLDAAEFLVKNMSADDVLDRVSHLEESHRLFLLQRWLEAHRRNSRAYEVALLALDIVLRDTSSAPKLRDLREIAIVVPHITDPQISDRVISRLEAQSSELVGHGTSEDAVRLRMLLLRGRQRWRSESIDADLIDLFAQVHGVSDVGIRTACYAWMLYHIGLLRDKESLEERTGVIAETTKHLLDATDLLLAQTAEHYVAAVDAVRAICMAVPYKALELVGRFNTRSRRDRGFAQVVRSLAVNKTYNDHAAIVVKGIGHVVDTEEREKLILYLLYRISKDQSVDSNAPVEPRLLILWKQVAHSTRKVQAMILTYKIINTSVSLRKPTTHLDDALEVWRDISDASVRVHVGYWVVSELAIVDRISAEKWLDMIREEAKVSSAPSFMASSQLFLVAGLAGRVFARYAAECPQDFDAALGRLSNIVAMIPALDEQAQVWSEIGVQLFFWPQRDLSQRVVERKIEPLLASNFDSNVVLQQSILFHVAPLLYLVSADAANARIERHLPAEKRDEIRDLIAGTILRKMLPSNFDLAPV